MRIVIQGESEVHQAGVSNHFGTTSTFVNNNFCVYFVFEEVLGVNCFTRKGQTPVHSLNIRRATGLGVYFTGVISGRAWD